MKQTREEQVIPPAAKVGRQNVNGRRFENVKQV